MFANQPFITELSVNSNFIYALPSDLFDYTEQLEVLDMKNNNIKELQQTIFYKTKALRQIDFSNNNLDTICKGLFAYQDCFNIKLQCESFLMESQMTRILFSYFWGVGGARSP